VSSEWIELAPSIKYLSASAYPLSADVVLIEGREHIWLFDVGSSDDVLQALQTLSKKPRIILSHFHPDHTANLDKLSFEALYVGSYTHQKIKLGTIVKSPIELDDGIHLRVFPLPSSHAKGSLALEVNETYAFLGDGAYSAVKQGRAVYNATLLKDELDVLRSIKAPWFLLSHANPFLQKKDDVITLLEAVYNQRCANSPDIYPKD